MHRNGSFTQNWLSEDTDIGPDGDLDVFVLPPSELGDDPPVLAGLDLAVALTDEPAAQDLLAHLATPRSTDAWAGAGGFIGVHDEVDQYASDFDRRIARLLVDAPIVAVDGSDQMHPAFGEGAFWELISQWAGGALTTEDVVVELDDAREDLTD
ncbi:MAG: hypothetical protein U5K30_11545 [Acidimicrobiales bacterium]|nr:hypothetical protein [Acidimicrobiales bacterium]